MIEAVLFDMDGLMFDTERMWSEAWQRAGAALGLPVDLALVNAMRGRNAAGCRRVCLERLGPGLDFAALQNTARAEMARMIDEGGLPKKPGLCELLELLRRRGIPAAVCTSTRRATTESHLDRAGVRLFFAALVCGDEVENGKPAPDIFLRGAALLHAEPRRCLVLEDSPSGVRAGAAAGCKTVMVPDLTPPTDELRALAAAVAGSLFDIPPLLEAL